MALEHALLVALREEPASGLDLARRFERSIGYFWHATHQQIYRVLARMDADGWVTVTEVSQHGRPDKKVYQVSATGAAVLSSWLAAPTPLEPLRSELAVKMRGAAYGDRDAVLEVVGANLADHQLRLAHYEQLERRDHPTPEALTGHELDQYLVLRGGIRTERFWVEWLTEYLTAHRARPTDPARTAPPPTHEGRLRV